MSAIKSGGDAAPPDPWDDYWRRTREAAAHKAGGPQDEVLARFWSGFFGDAFASGAGSRLLDVACGNGAATAYALEVAGRLGRQLPRPIALDSSLAALIDLRRRLPGVSAVVADARRAPFASSSFDVVASQFGLEYAGPPAFEEAARLLAEGGVLGAVLHLKGGAIYRENTANLAATKALRDSALLEATREAFSAELAVRMGKGGRARLRSAEARLEAAVLGVSGALQHFGSGVAGGALERLRDDVVHMHHRKQTHEPAEVVRWAAAMSAETEAYAGRMATMLDAAVDEAALHALTRRMADQGLRLRIHETMLMGAMAQPGAWIVVFDRPRKNGGPKPAVS
jgi:SAM-dependent methyltransferase